MRVFVLFLSVIAGRTHTAQMIFRTINPLIGIGHRARCDKCSGPKTIPPSRRDPLTGPTLGLVARARKRLIDCNWSGFGEPNGSNKCFPVFRRVPGVGETETGSKTCERLAHSSSLVEATFLERAKVSWVEECDANLWIWRVTTTLWAVTD